MRIHGIIDLFGNLICAFCGKGKARDFQAYKNSKTHMSEKKERVMSYGNDDNTFQGRIQGQSKWKRQI